MIATTTLYMYIKDICYNYVDMFAYNVVKKKFKNICKSDT